MAVSVQKKTKPGKEPKYSVRIRTTDKKTKQRGCLIDCDDLNGFIRASRNTLTKVENSSIEDYNKQAPTIPETYTEDRGIIAHLYSRGTQVPAVEGGWTKKATGEELYVAQTWLVYMGITAFCNALNAICSYNEMKPYIIEGFNGSAVVVTRPYDVITS